MANNKLDVIRNFLSVTSKLAHPGFARAFGIDAETILRGNYLEDAYSYQPDKKELLFQYTIPEQAAVRGKLQLSGFLCLFDEVTTMAILAEDRERRPGVSLSLFAELGPEGLHGKIGRTPGDVVTIRAKVVKTGNVFAFIDVDAVDGKTGTVICTGRHTKYLPMGGGLLPKLVLGPLLPLVKMVTDRLPHKDSCHLHPTLDDLLQLEELTPNHKTGRCHVEPGHTNPMGSAHGGWLAMMMEHIGQVYADANVDADADADADADVDASSNGKYPLLRSIMVTYMSPGKKEIEFDADWTHVAEHSASMSVKVNNSISGKPIAEGMLHFVTDQQIKYKNCAFVSLL